MTEKSTYEPFKIDIIGTGSSGNCVVIDNSIVIDCGLPIKKIGQTVINADALFITHRHSDHLNLSILHHLYRKAPWKLTQSLYTNADVEKKIIADRSPRFEPTLNQQHIYDQHSNIQITAGGRQYAVQMFPLHHDVENEGFVFTRDDGKKLIYATDTNSIADAPSEKFDAIMLEGNFDEDKIIDYLKSDDFNERFRAMRNMRHLSVQQFENFVSTHAKSQAEIYQLHESGTFGIESTLAEN